MTLYYEKKNEKAGQISAADYLAVICAQNSVFIQLSGLPTGVHPAQRVGAAGVEEVSVQKLARPGWVAVHVKEAEAGGLQLPQQAEPVTHHGRVIAAHLKARPVQVQLQ